MSQTAVYVYIHRFARSPPTAYDYDLSSVWFCCLIHIFVIFFQTNHDEITCCDVRE